MDLDKIGPPITAREMRDLKAQEDEKKRWQFISGKIAKIYSDTIRYAKLNTETKFVYYPTGGSREDEFLNENKKDIISNLEKLFPGCRISYRTYVHGGNSKMCMCDITDMNEETKKSFSNQCLGIVIDWS
jgi:hypothetical protein